MKPPRRTGGAWMKGLGLVSVIIPAYNEESRLPAAIDAIEKYLTTAGADYEVLVVDDGSTDGTATVLNALQTSRRWLRLVQLLVNRGKGAAVKAGMEAASGEYILFTDADQSTSIEQLPKVVEPLLAGFDIAMGSRAVDGARIDQGQGWFRQMLGKSFGNLAQLLLVRGYGDSQCGFKCFRRSAALAIFPQITTSTVLFDVEVLLLAARRGSRVAEVPVCWRHEPDSRIRYDLKRTIAVFAELLRLRQTWGVWLPVKVDVTVVRRAEPDGPAVPAASSVIEGSSYSTTKSII